MGRIQMIKATSIDRTGFALVTTILIILVLSVLAVGIVWLAATEKQIISAELTHNQSLFSADAGGEAAINFIRLSDLPPQIQDFTTMSVNSVGSTNIAGTQNYDYSCLYANKSARPGWGVDYKDYGYRVLSHGTASRTGESGTRLILSRLFREGY